MRVITFLTFFILASSLYAQDTSKKEKIHARFISTDGKPAVGFEAKVNNVEKSAYTDNTGYFIIDGNRETNMLYLYNRYADTNFTFNITHNDNDPDTIQIVKIEWSVYGRVIDEEGNGIPNINVEVVGSDQTTTTNWDGGYVLKNLTQNDRLKIVDPKNHRESKIVYMTSVRNNTQKVELPLKIPASLASQKDGIGVAYLSDKTPSGSGVNHAYNDGDIGSITPSQNGYIIKPSKTRYFTSGIESTFRSTVGFSYVGRLPEIQSTYAQGKTNLVGQLQWNGAENNETFSWGPAIQDLEFDGKSYLYDKNGGLVAKGTGNGVAANSYDPTDFFRTGFSFSNDLKTSASFINKSILSINLGQEKTTTPIPNAYHEMYKGSLLIEKLKLGKFSSDFGFFTKHSHLKFPTMGGNYARLMHSVLTTTPTFDNTNGMDSKDAVKNNESWQLENGKMRSYAPAYVKNPYSIINNSHDKEKTEDLLVYAKTSYNIRKFENEASISFNKQWNDKYMDIPINSESLGSYLLRKEKSSDLNINLKSLYKLNNKVNLHWSYLYGMYNNDVSSYGSPFLGHSRKTHQVNYGATFKNSIFNLEIKNKHYFSTTNNDYTNLFPYAGIGINFGELSYKLFDDYYRIWKDLSLFASAERSVGEAPIIYKNRSVLSTVMPSALFGSFYEYTEIPFYEGLNPEIYMNTEVGLRKRVYMNDNQFDFEALYFHNTTWDFLAPNMVTSTGIGGTYQYPRLENVGRIHNYGYLFSASYYFYNYYSKFRGSLVLNFSHSKSKVSSAKYKDTPLALSGFSDIRTVFSEGEPLGVIYGTTYLRDDKGEVQYDQMGYPMVDSELKKIGDPTPDFTLTLFPTLRFKRVNLSLLLEYSHGGDRWNGTRAYLDYLGMSQETANLRNEMGTEAVMDRYTRYGSTGVGEQYIEDASYFRLSEVGLSYNIINNQNNHDKFVKDLEVGARANNLLLITSYKGVDPASTLFGYSTGTGLDLFNTPSSRSFSFFVNLKF